MSQQIVSTWDGVANTNSWVHDGDVERSAVDIVELASSVAGYSAGAQAAADAASGYADTASAAVASIGTAATDAVQAVQDEGAAQMSALVDAGGVQSALIGSAGAAQIADIVTSGGVVTSAIADAGSAEIADIVSAGGAQVALVSAAGTSATGDLAAVTAAQSAALVSVGAYQSGLIVTAGSAQIAAVQAEGGTQIAAVQLAASAQVGSATAAAITATSAATAAQTAASGAISAGSAASGYAAATSGYMVSAGGYATSAGSAATAASGYAVTASGYMTSAGGYAETAEQYISSVTMAYLGAVATTGDLPAGGADAQAFYYVEADGKHYVWRDGAWTELTAQAWVIYAADKPEDAAELDALYGVLYDGGMVIFGADPNVNPQYPYTRAERVFYAHGSGDITVKTALDESIKGLSISGRTITVTRWDGTIYTLQTEDTTYGNATETAAGLMSAADKAKLDGVANNANYYVHPTYSAHGNDLYKVSVSQEGHVISAALVKKADITALGIPAQDTTYSAATTSAAGLMSAEDKVKLDSIASGANAYVYAAYSAVSTSAAAELVDMSSLCDGGVMIVTID